MADDEQFVEDSNTAFLEDGDTEKDISMPAVSKAVAHVQSAFTRSKSTRLFDEMRWLKAYRNYRGIYGPDVVFSEQEKCQVFIKITKTKVLAAYSQIVDVLFSNSSFPLTIEPTQLPENIVEAAHFDPNDKTSEDDAEPVSPYGFKGDGNDPQPGATARTLADRLGPLKGKFAKLIGLKEGEGETPSSFTIHPAMFAAKKMQKKIHDQLDESGASHSLRMTAFECALFGTGFMTGPFAEDKESPKWSDDGTYAPVFTTAPRSEAMSIWDAYPDPDAVTLLDSSHFIRRRKMSRPQLRKLDKRPYFRKKAIDAVIASGPNYTKEHWEDSLRDYTNDTSEIERWEVLEYWGYIDADQLDDDAESIIPTEFKDKDQLQVNLWVCDGKVLRFVINPFKPQRIPFYGVPYELNPYSIFGIGVGENMDDTQHLMNGFMRMAVDNGVLSGNLLIEIDEANLVPGQDLSVHAGKVFRRSGGAPGQAIFGTKFPNVSQENMQMFDKARQLADDATGIPSFSHGQTGVSGVGRTAAGISMLMGAAGGAIKSVIKNFDDFLLRPIGEAFFAFNMQFDHDPSIKGDLEVKARGTDSLMATEVRSQRLMTFLQVAGQNQNASAYAKYPYIMREIAKSLSLDPDKATNSPEEAARQMMMNPPPASGMGHNGGPPMQAGAPGQAGSPSDLTGAGGGNIGVGAAAVPGEEQFTGNNASQGNSQPAEGASV